MKKLLLLSILLIIPLLFSDCSPPDASGYMPMMASVSACTENCALYTTCQNFETATTGYDNGPEAWTEGGTGSVDHAYTGVILRGTQSWRVYGVAGWKYAYKAITATDEIYIHWLFDPATLPATNNSYIVELDNGTTTECGLIIEYSTEALRAEVDGTHYAITTGTLTAGTAEHIWEHYKKASVSPGSDGICSVGFGTGLTEVTAGNNFAAVTNHTVTAQINRVYIEKSGTATPDLIFDQVLTSPTEITSVCP